MRFVKPIFVVVLVSQLFAQQPNVKQPVLEAMDKISVMIGIWEGRGWQINQQREKHFSNVHENVQWKLDSTLILIEGRGTNDDGMVVHNALAFLAFDPFKKTYNMHSYLSNGLNSEAEFSVLEPNQSFLWTINDNHGGTIRYTITVTQAKHWREVGEYSRDGEKWNQFFEMSLEKTK